MRSAHFYCWLFLWDMGRLDEETSAGTHQLAMFRSVCDTELMKREMPRMGLSEKFKESWTLPVRRDRLFCEVRVLKTRVSGQLWPH